jgi:F-type H+-transporting ATPase subunit gamma
LATLRDLKRQIGSVKNIAKVTEALQTVSAVKFRKAESRVKKARPYAENVEQIMRDVARSATGSSPLLAGREVRRVAIATITADRGLAGGFNAQVLRQTVRLRQEQDAETVQVASGRKAVAFFRFRRVELTKVYTGFSDSPTYEQAREIGQALMRLFDDEEADEVYLVYNRFESALRQRPTVTRLLPVGPDTGEDEEDQEDESNVPLEFIPDPEKLLKRLVPKYVETLIFRALVESAAGEHGARMTAMQSASDAANEMAEELTQQMNKARQAAITQEIIEIASAAEALAG